MLEYFTLLDSLVIKGYNGVIAYIQWYLLCITS